MFVQKSRARHRRGPTLWSAVAIGSTLAVGTAAVLVTDALTTPANAAGQRVNLRALVVSAGDVATQALAAELDREGIPYTTVKLGAANRPVINAAFLEDTANGVGRFQAVFLPNQA